MDGSTTSDSKSTNAPVITADATMVGLLVKLGVEPAAAMKFIPERAEKKAKNRLADRGIPNDLTDDERGLVKKLGIAPAPYEPPTTLDPADDADGDNTDTPIDPKIKRTFRLAGIKGQPDRTEIITGETAEMRNKRRTDDRRWEPEPDAAPEIPTSGKPAKPPAEKPLDAGTQTSVEGVADEPNNPTIPKPGDTVTKKVKKHLRAVAAADQQTASKRDAAKTAAKKPTPTVKTAKSAKPKPTAAATAASTPTPGKKIGKKRADGKPRGGYGLFVSMFESGRAIPKTDTIAKLVAAGVSPGTASAYITWGKNPLKGWNHKGVGHPLNPFGIRIVETKNDKGVKILQRVQTGASHAAEKPTAKPAAKVHAKTTAKK